MINGYFPWTLNSHWTSYAGRIYPIAEVKPLRFSHSSRPTMYSQKVVRGQHVSYYRKSSQMQRSKCVHHFLCVNVRKMNCLLLPIPKMAPSSSSTLLTDQLVECFRGYWANVEAEWSTSRPIYILPYFEPSALQSLRDCGSSTAIPHPRPPAIHIALVFAIGSRFHRGHFFNESVHLFLQWSASSGAGTFHTRGLRGGAWSPDCSGREATSAIIH